jgi:hypothetical protein
MTMTEHQIRVMKHFVTVCAEDERVRGAYPGLADRAQDILKRLGAAPPADDGYAAGYAAAWDAANAIVRKAWGKDLQTLSFAADDGKDALIRELVTALETAMDETCDENFADAYEAMKDALTKAREAGYGL